MQIRHWELAGAEDDRHFSPNCWRVRMALHRREKRFCRRLEDLGAESKASLPALRGVLDPVRSMLVTQNFVSGASPGFTGYILFGLKEN